MRDHHEPAQSEEVATPCGLRIEARPQLPRRRPDEEAADLAAHAGAELGAERAEQRPDRPLERLQRDVAGEAVADDDVADALEQLPALDVALEAERALLEQCMAAG